MNSRPDIDFRPARPDDAAFIRDLVRAAYAKWVPVIGREPQPMKADYTRAVIEHQIDLLHADGVVVGLIETRLESDHLWIENIAVTPVRQGQGYGMLLLGNAEHRASTAGLNELRLLTNEAMTANIALYERVGYTVDRREPFISGGITLYMSKRLPSQA